MEYQHKLLHGLWHNMKKYGYNSGYIGVDYRQEEAGVISQQKFSIERYRGGLQKAGSGLINQLVSDGLILLLDASDASSYSGTGTTWYDLSGNENHWTLFGSPVYNSTNGDPSNTFIDFDSTDDYAKQTSAPISGLTNDMTVCWVVKSTDTGNGMIASKTTGGGGYLAAFQTNGGFYHNSVGSPVAYIDTIANNSSVGLKDSFHLLEFKSVDFSGWTSNINMPAAYSGFIFQGEIKAMFMYDRSLTDGESTTNYTALQTLGYL